MRLHREAEEAVAGSGGNRRIPPYAGTAAAANAGGGHTHVAHYSLAPSSASTREYISAAERVAPQPPSNAVLPPQAYAGSRLQRPRTDVFTATGSVTGITSAAAAAEDEDEVVMDDDEAEDGVQHGSGSGSGSGSSRRRKQEAHDPAAALQQHTWKVRHSHSHHCSLFYQLTSCSCCVSSVYHAVSE